MENILPIVSGHILYPTPKEMPCQIKENINIKISPQGSLDHSRRLTTTSTERHKCCIPPEKLWR